MSETIRSFIAFDIKNQSILDRFSNVQRLLLDTGAELKLVEPKNIHITLRFLGNISVSTIDSTFEAMKQVSFTAFDCEIHDVGVFPSLNYARVVWAGIRKGADELKDVVGQLEPHLQNLGFKADRKGFSPHLTLARVKTGRNKAELTHCIQELANFDFGVVRADCLRLKKSILTPKGPVYSTLREVCR